MDLSLGKGAYRRDDADAPEYRLVNMYVEESPTSETGLVLLGRPGLVEHHDFGGGPVNGLFYKSGSVIDDLVTLAGNVLYSGTAAMGGVMGGGIARFAATESEMLVTAGDVLRRTDGVTVEDAGVTFSGNCASVMYLAGRFLALREGTGEFHYSGVLDGRDWDALNYYTAESSPDLLIDGIVVNDEAWLFGTESTEVWVSTGAGDDPYARVEGRNYSKGILNAGALTLFDNTACWVGNNGLVYRGDARPLRISTHGIEERIAASDACYLSTFVDNGHEFLNLRTDQGNFCYDAATQQWCEFQSYGFEHFRGQVCAVMDRAVFWGDDSTGQVWTFSRAAYQDDGQPVTAIFTAGVPLDGPWTCDRLSLNVSAGSAALGIDPVIEMRASRDGGHDWTSWDEASLGSQGEYRTKAEWRANGMFDEPGALFEFRITDPTLRRVSSVRANNPGGRRG